MTTESGVAPGHAISQAVQVHVDIDDSGFAARLYAEIVSAESAVVLLQTSLQAKLIAALGPFSRRAGQAMYVFDEERGFVSLREEGIVVPQTKRTAEALRYVLQSSHFGVYFFPNGASHIRAQNGATLKQMGRRRPAGEKRIVLMCEAFEAIEPLLDVSALVEQRSRASGPLKLRDGCWIRG